MIHAPENLGEIFEPEEGYNRAASAYDKWHWQRFWTENEGPIIRGMLSESPPPRNVLDVGVGTGRNMQLLRSLGYAVSGVDVSRNMLRVAAGRLGGAHGLYHGDVRSLPFVDEEFDFALCCRVLSHLDTLEGSLGEISRVLRRGGRLLITDIDGRHDYVATRIPVDGADLFIRVYKHTLEHVLRIASGQGLRRVASKLVRAQDLAWQPSREQFPRIDWSGKLPVFYALLVEKT